MAQPLWTVGDLVAATRGEAADAALKPVTGISIDTRTLQPGDAYVAIRGVSQDGHRYVPAALEAGAAVALVEQGYEGRDPRLIRVPDPFAALQDLARAARGRVDDSVVIAVTGSAGKTGTKEALRVALSPSGPVHASVKSYNNHWGVPLSLANMAADTAFGVFEAGMNHAGELTPLSQMIRPHIAIVTTVEPVHLGHFGSVEEIADAKAEIFSGIEPGGTAILNRDNPHFERLAAAARQAGARIVSFGEAQDADIRLLEATLSPDGSAVTASIGGRELRFGIAAPGRHLVQNALAVLGAVQAAGADLDLAASALAEWRAGAGRGERQLYGSGERQTAIVDEAYNANPASMRAALATLGLTPRESFRRRVVVLGDMLELGPEAESFHSGLAEHVDAAGVDVVFACGDLMGGLFAALPEAKRGAYARTAEELTPLVLDQVRPGDVVMIKGSFGSRLAPLVEALKQHLEGEAARA